MSPSAPCKRCGYPEQLGPGPYRGEPIGTVDGHELRRLTDHELRHAGQELYCLAGETHWNPAAFFVYQAEEVERSARRLREAASLLQLRTEKRS